jgi:hypothetical protein
MNKMNEMKQKRNSRVTTKRRRTTKLSLYYLDNVGKKLASTRCLCLVWSIFFILTMTVMLVSVGSRSFRIEFVVCGVWLSAKFCLSFHVYFFRVPLPTGSNRSCLQRTNNLIRVSYFPPMNLYSNPKKIILLKQLCLDIRYRTVWCIRVVYVV